MYCFSTPSMLISNKETTFIFQSFLDVYYGSPLPVEVKKGTIGRISLTVPYSSFFTQPVVINIEVKFTKK